MDSKKHKELNPLYDYSVTTWLKEVLKGFGFSQRKAAEICDLDEASISHFCNHSSPPYRTALRMAACLDEAARGIGIDIATRLRLLSGWIIYLGYIPVSVNTSGKRAIWILSQMSGEQQRQASAYLAMKFKPRKNSKEADDE